MCRDKIITILNVLNCSMYFIVPRLLIISIYDDRLSSNPAVSIKTIFFPSVCCAFGIRTPGYLVHDTLLELILNCFASWGSYASYYSQYLFSTIFLSLTPAILRKKVVFPTPEIPAINMPSLSLICCNYSVIFSLDLYISWIFNI